MDASSADSGAAVRDLMGLLALPTLWVGKDGMTIMRIMMDAVGRIVPISAVLARVSLPPRDQPVLILKAGTGAPNAEIPEAWHRFVADCQAVPAGQRLHAVDSPAGALTLIHLHMAMGSQKGEIWFASGTKGFPTANHAALVRAAASLAASGLTAARIEHERARAQRAKDEFLAMLGHELRNPLAPIVSALGLIRIKGSGQLDREHELIERQVGHLSRLVDDLLDITRITRDRIELRKELVDLRQIVAEAAEGVTPLLEERGHELVVHAELAYWVEGDRARLRQVLANLLTNAAKYTPAGGRITISVGQAAELVEVSVEDNGLGIDPALLPRIFDLFEQGPTTMERARGGLGIGLAIVKKVVELHDGAVFAHSQGTGKGARFVVRLPTAQAKDLPAPGADHPSATEGTGQRVLLVDDNVDALETMQVLLSLSGFVVESAKDPAEAMQKAAGFAAHAYVLDIGLPGMSGYELAAELRRTGGPGARQARYIALTGYGQESDKARAAESGFAQHLVKPVHVQDLVAALRK